ncbi:Penicillin amidase [Lentibacillus halodurans]|uniref:Penicillin amidase n=1 Tax=Lentibacillus halodurans TaxID=237679 RepID=A0A1I1A4W3_9BACI|nr:Penicillin amidase [Lentibacillus halodurans]
MTVEDMKALQMDQTNLQARAFVPMFIEVLDVAHLSDEQGEALGRLSKWDYLDEVEASQPLIFHRWMNEIEKLLYDNEFPEEVMEFLAAKARLRISF